jgi:hypothetical protein
MVNQPLQILPRIRTKADSIRCLKQAFQPGLYRFSRLLN